MKGFCFSVRTGEQIIHPNVPGSFSTPLSWGYTHPTWKKTSLQRGSINPYGIGLSFPSPIIYGSNGYHFRTYHQNWTAKFVDIYQAALLITRKAVPLPQCGLLPWSKWKFVTLVTPPPTWRLTCPLKRRGNESSSNHQFWGQVLVFMVVASWASNNHEWLHAGSAYKSLSWCYNLLKT